MFKAALLIVLLAAATQAFATITYRMVGGECTDSNRTISQVQDPETGWMDNIIGPKVCADGITAELRLSDDYVPGDEFFESGYYGRGVLEYLRFDDGVQGLGTDFLGGYSGRGFARGAMPADVSGEGGIEMYWYEGIYFEIGGGGWFLNVEYGAGNAPCAMGSGESGTCVPTLHYRSAGTYTGWQRVIAVPEPGTLGLLALGLAGVGLTRTRRTFSSP